MGDRYVESDENIKLIYIDANNLYGWAMGQPKPCGNFQKLTSIYENEDEPMAEGAKVRFLFKKVQHSCSQCTGNL